MVRLVRRTKTIITCGAVLALLYFLATQPGDVNSVAADSGVPESQEKTAHGQRMAVEKLLVSIDGRSKYEYLSNRIKDYCNIPYDKPSGSDGRVDVSKYRIVAVHVVMKAGHRASRFSVPKAVPLPCTLDQSAFEQFAYKAGEQFATQYRPIRSALKQSPGVEQPLVNGNESLGSGCQRGQLTALGMVQNVVFGTHLANIYQNEWQVLASGEQGKRPGLRLRVGDSLALLDSANAFLFGFLRVLLPGDAGATSFMQRVLQAFETRATAAESVNTNAASDSLESRFTVQFTSSPNMCTEREGQQCACSAISTLQKHRNKLLRDLVATGARPKNACNSLKEPMNVALNETPSAVHVANYYQGAEATEKDGEFCVLPQFVDTFLPPLCLTHEFPCRPGAQLQTQLDRLGNCVQPVDVEKLFDATDYINYQVKNAQQQVVFGAMYVYPFLADITKSISNQEYGVHLHFAEDELVRSLVFSLNQHAGRQLGFSARWQVEVLESVADASVHLRFLINGDDVTKQTSGCLLSPCPVANFLRAVQQLPSYALRTYDAQQRLDESEAKYNVVCDRLSSALAALPAA